MAKLIEPGITKGEWRADLVDLVIYAEGSDKGFLYAPDPNPTEMPTPELDATLRFIAASPRVARPLV